MRMGLERPDKGRKGEEFQTGQPMKEGEVERTSLEDVIRRAKEKAARLAEEMNLHKAAQHKPLRDRMLGGDE